MKPINKLLSFYKNYYKELHQETIKSPSFLIMLEFDIVVRFNIRPTKEELKQIIEAIKEDKMEKQLTRGWLVLQDNKRFGAITKEFSSGTPVEVFIEGKLIKGTIEYSWENEEYYLLGDDNVYYKLKNNMEILFY